MSMFSAALTSLRAILADKGMLSFFVVAVPFYSFFYPLPYASEAVRHIPIDVVDLEAWVAARLRIGRDAGGQRKARVSGK